MIRKHDSTRTQSEHRQHAAAYRLPLLPVLPVLPLLHLLLTDTH
jgi:hypothetical protein